MGDMVQVITLGNPKTSTNAELRRDIRELERLSAERKAELNARKARAAEEAERYPDSRSIERRQRMSPYDRTKAAVYATGNKWAIENFEATHS